MSLTITQADYPVHSYPVFPKNQMHGQTLVKFWHELFLEAFPEDIDLSIFDITEKRNRSLSRLMNRAGSPGFNHKWFESLSARLDSILLLRLSHAWIRRLNQWHYEPDSLSRRLKVFTEQIADRNDLRS